MKQYQCYYITTNLSTNTVFQLQSFCNSVFIIIDTYITEFLKISQQCKSA